MPKILAIFEEIPEGLYVATLEVAPEQLEQWKLLNQCVINSTDLTEAQTDIICAFGDLVKDADREHGDTSGGTFDAVIIMGFVL